MAKLTGLIKLEGTIEDLTFSRTRDGYQAKKKAFVSKESRNNSTQYDRTRENMAEFGRATKGGQVLRKALRTLLKVAKDRKMAGRVVAQMMNVLKLDTGNLRDQRTVTGGNLALLERLEFNIQSPLAQTLKAQYTSTIERTTGTAQVQLPAMTPLSDIAAPQGTTHYQLISALVAINFEDGSYMINQRDSAILPWTAASTPALTLSPAIAAASTQPLFLVLGVQYFQEFVGTYYPLKDIGSNALAIIRVEAN
jgi:hypothetical protein